MKEDKEQSLVAHLEELRNTLIKCILSVVIVLPFVFYFSPKFLNIVTRALIGKNQITLNYFSPMEVFLIQLKLALLVTVAICFPYIAKKIWDFILPALYENEKKFIGMIITYSSILFFAGVGFCLFVILPLIINFGMSFAQNNIHAMFGISNIINLALSLAVVFGIMFQIPLVVKLLIKWDIVSYETISSIRPYVCAVLLILSALFTPPDIISQILLFIPTYTLFEFGLLLSRKKEKIDSQSSD